MMDNAARQLEPTPEKPLTQPVQPVQPAAAPAVHSASLTWIERGLAVLVGVVMLGMCLAYLMSQNQLANANRTYQDLSRQIETQTQEINNYKQSVGELTSADRLENFAKANGLTVINRNIKRVGTK